MKIAIGVLAATAVLAAAGCGKSDAEKQAEADQAQSGGGTITCEGSATAGKTGLPAGFPKPAGVTYVKASTTGPGNVVDGYGTDSVQSLHDAYKTEFKSAGYVVTFDEIEKDGSDSEVSYKTGDTPSTEGTVALRGGDSCDNGHVSVHITNRPSD